MHDWGSLAVCEYPSIRARLLCKGWITRSRFPSIFGWQRTYIVVTRSPSTAFPRVIAHLIAPVLQFVGALWLVVCSYSRIPVCQM